MDTYEGNLPDYLVGLICNLILVHLQGFIILNKISDRIEYYNTFMTFAFHRKKLSYLSVYVLTMKSSMLVFPFP